MSLQFLELYGVITEILPDGEISVGEPVFICDTFTNSRIPKITNSCTPKKYYRFRFATVEAKGREGGGIRTYPIGFEEVDLSQYGKPLFLPVAREKVGDGKKYCILFQKSKDATVTENGMPVWYKRVTIRVEKDFSVRLGYTPVLLTVGIQFPNKFVAKMSKGSFLTPAELKPFIGEVNRRFV